MKKLLFVLPIATLISCGGSAEPAGDTDTTAVTTSAVNDSNTVTTANAADVKFFEENPESVARYFYASQIRGDKSWESVCHLPEERSPKFTQDLTALDEKDIMRYTHLKTDWLENICNVHVELEYTDDSMGSASGVSEYIVFLEHIDGIWWIVGFSDEVLA